MLKPDIPEDEDITGEVVDRYVSPAEGAIGRRHGAPEVVIDGRIGDACERLRLDRIGVLLRKVLENN